MPEADRDPLCGAAWVHQQVRRGRDPGQLPAAQGDDRFRTTPASPLDEDLRTGIEGADYKVAFEIDSIDAAAREGWSVMVQGAAHPVEDRAERTELTTAGVDPWPGGDKELFIRIAPTRITGRRIHQR